MNDDGNDNDDYSGDNNKNDEVQVIKPTKTSVNGAIDTPMIYTMFHNKHRDKICRTILRTNALLKRERSTHATQ